jgi:hypothetical protein
VPTEVEAVAPTDRHRRLDENTVEAIPEVKAIATTTRELDDLKDDEWSDARRLPRGGGGGYRVHHRCRRATRTGLSGSAQLRSGRRFRIFEDQFGSAPPYATEPDALFVAFYASAELGVYRVLGWSRPERVLDLFVEFRNHTNGLPTPAGSSLLGALAYFGLDGMGAVEKHTRCRRQSVMALGEGVSRRKKSSTTAKVT